MSELRPYPFGHLVEHMLRELGAEDAIFGLPARRFVLGLPGKDLRVDFHGHQAATPFGPAAGPHTQMAQNLVLAWLAGGRVHELKTVQTLDELKIPRPCIDVQTVGYNIEWSQELKLEQSLEEYVKGAMLIHILREAGDLHLAPDFGGTVFDMSVGYDLAGIQDPRVQAFLAGMQDATPIVDRLRMQIPDALAHLRDLDFPTRLSDTLTLSTFHGCPPEEIERIAEFLIAEVGLHTIVKLNPTLLGPSGVRELLNVALGYAEIEVPDSAFANDTRWSEALAFCHRLKDFAAARGRGFGVKFSNTLVVKNHRDFFPVEQEQMYLSGPPLHVLAMHLVRRFRREFGDEIPISFSAGIDKHNFADALALGLLPVTVCTDLLKPGGYGRGQNYFKELGRRLDAAQVSTLDAFILKAMGHAEAALEQVATGEEERSAGRSALDSADCGLAALDPDLRHRWLAAAKLLNTETYVEGVADDPWYAAQKNLRTPRKVGSMLDLFDCLSCDICIPVCPNASNFAFDLPATEIRQERTELVEGRWRCTSFGTLRIEAKHQIGNFADFCNDCGNCDVFCPEDGGPYAVKPRFYRSAEQWRADQARHGFFLERGAERARVLGRFPGGDYIYEIRREEVRYQGAGFDLRFDSDDPAGTMGGKADGPVDLTYYHVMTLLLHHVTAAGQTNFVATLSRA